MSDEDTYADDDFEDDVEEEQQGACVTGRLPLPALLSSPSNSPLALAALSRAAAAARRRRPPRL